MEEKKINYGHSELQVPLRHSREVEGTLIYGLELTFTKAAWPRNIY